MNVMTERVPVWVTCPMIASSMWRLSVQAPLTCVTLANARAIAECRAAVAAGTNEADGRVEYVNAYNNSTLIVFVLMD